MFLIVSFKVFAISFDKKIGDIVISRSNPRKDLRVYFTFDFSFKIHISKIVSGAIKMLGFIICACHDFVSTDTIKLLASELSWSIVLWFKAVRGTLSRWILG